MIIHSIFHTGTTLSPKKCLQTFKILN